MNSQSNMYKTYSLKDPGYTQQENTKYKRFVHVHVSVFLINYFIIILLLLPKLYLLMCCYMDQWLACDTCTGTLLLLLVLNGSWTDVTFKFKPHTKYKTLTCIKHVHNYNMISFNYNYTNIAFLHKSVTIHAVHS